jgi:regulatory protein
LIVKKRLSSSWLQRSALHYVQRYPASVQRVRQVMMRRIDRKLREHEGDRTVLLEELDALLVAFQRGGHLDDLRQAGLWLDTWHRKGLSARGMRAKLAEKGVPYAVVAEAVQEFFDQADDCEGGLELEAANNYARRRHLGPYRQRLEQRGERRQRDLAALARQGFSFEIARQVIDSDCGV